MKRNLSRWSCFSFSFSSSWNKTAVFAAPVPRQRAAIPPRHNEVKAMQSATDFRNWLRPKFISIMVLWSPYLRFLLPPFKRELEANWLTRIDLFSYQGARGCPLPLGEGWGEGLAVSPNPD